MSQTSRPSSSVLPSAGTTFPDHDHPGGEELFVIDGNIEDAHGAYGPGSWVRYPVGSRHEVYSAAGCTFYVKAGHLAG